MGPLPMSLTWLLSVAIYWLGSSVGRKPILFYFLNFSFSVYPEISNLPQDKISLVDLRPGLGEDEE